MRRRSWRKKHPRRKKTEGKASKPNGVSLDITGFSPSLSTLRFDEALRCVEDYYDSKRMFVFPVEAKEVIGRTESVEFPAAETLQE